MRLPVGVGQGALRVGVLDSLDAIVAMLGDFGLALNECFFER